MFWFCHKKRIRVSATTYFVSFAASILQCESCSVEFASTKELITHLETHDIHILSLHNCACQGDDSKLEKLVRCTDDLTKRCRSHFISNPASAINVGYSPLHCVVMNKFHKCVLKLLRWGANPNLQDESGSTPLHLAADRGMWKTALLLLKYGGNFFLPNNKGQTAFDLADPLTKREILECMFVFESKLDKLLHFLSHYAFAFCI